MKNKLTPAAKKAFVIGGVSVATYVFNYVLRNMLSVLTPFMLREDAAAFTAFGVLRLFGKERRMMRVAYIVTLFLFVGMLVIPAGGVTVALLFGAIVVHFGYRGLIVSFVVIPVLGIATSFMKTKKNA